MALKENLVSHWKLEEDGTTTRADAHGSNDCPITDGTVGSATGQIDTAANFDGQTSDRMRINAPSADLAGGTNIKIAVTAWVNPSDLTALRLIASDWVSVASQRSWNFYIDTTGKLRIDVRNAADTAYGVLASDATISTGSWYFVAWWYDGAVLGCRVNQTEKTVAYTGDIQGTSGTGADFAIGSYNVTGQLPMNGLIDELSIWRKSVVGTERILVSSQMDTLYAGGSGLNFDLWDKPYALFFGTVA